MRMIQVGNQVFLVGGQNPNALSAKQVESRLKYADGSLRFCLSLAALARASDSDSAIVDDTIWPRAATPQPLIEPPTKPRNP